MPFYIVLRNLRRQNDLTQKQLGNALGISESTVGMYERGKREPDFKTLEAIADYFNVDMDYLTGRSTIQKKYPFEPSLSVAESCPTIPIYNALNKAGKEEYLRYGRYLTSQSEYLAKDTKPQVEYIRHYLTAAAAGYAAPIEGEQFEWIPRDPSAPAQADFCIEVVGDSMEPYIKDGQRIYVQRDVSLSDLDVGVFFVDGDVYCKQYCIDYAGTLMLLSANPLREDANKYFSKDSGQNVACLGKVLLPHKLPMPKYYKAINHINKRSQFYI